MCDHVLCVCERERDIVSVVYGCLASLRCNVRIMHFRILQNLNAT